LAPMVVSFNGHHPVTERLPQRLSGPPPSALILTETRPVEISPTRFPADLDADTLFLSGDSAWSDAELQLLLEQQRVPAEPASREAIPLAAAVVRQLPGRSAHLVIIGDSDFLNDSRRISLSDAGVGTLLRDAFKWVAPEDSQAFLADPGLQVPLRSEPGRLGADGHALGALAAAALLLLGGIVSLAARRRTQAMAPGVAPLVIAVGLSILLGPWLASTHAAATQARPAAHLISLAPGQVASITLTTDKGQVDLERAAAGWQLRGESGPADAQAVDLLLHMLEQRQRHSVQPLPPAADLAALGLDPGRVRLTLTGRAGQTTTLILGDVPDGSCTQVWARVDGEDSVFTTDGDLATVAARPAERWEAVP
jgi:hypothetical protein